MNEKFTGKEWLEALPDEVQARWHEEVHAHIKEDPTVDEVLNTEFSGLRWFLWASFSIKNSIYGMEYWHEVFDVSNSNGVKQTLIRNKKIDELGIL